MKKILAYLVVLIMTAACALYGYDLNDAKDLVGKQILKKSTCVYNPAVQHGTLSQVVDAIQFMSESIQTISHNIARSVLEKNDERFSKNEDRLIDSMNKFNALLCEFEHRVINQLGESSKASQVPNLVRIFRSEFCLTNLCVMSKAASPNADGPAMDRYRIAAERASKTLREIYDLAPSKPGN